MPPRRLLRRAAATRHHPCRRPLDRGDVSGVLMDRFGTRNVTLFFVWASAVLAPLFPLVSWFWSLLLLQLVNGAAVSFAWSGAQTLIAQLAEGDAGYIGKFSFFARLGSTTAPMLAGAVWDYGGAWPA